MSLADFQNPIANMPLMQQMQQTQHQAQQFSPIINYAEYEEELNEKSTTVQESDEQEEKDRINKEDEDAGGKRKRFPSRRAPKIEEQVESSQSKAPLKDGVHGRFLDIQA